MAARKSDAKRLEVVCPFCGRKVSVTSNKDDELVMIPHFEPNLGPFCKKGSLTSINRCHRASYGLPAPVTIRDLVASQVCAA
ncbi:hypothetical protein KKI23_01915 [Patescibacteria group bacterium]|nr:hypothetical protein [Patescibacteria group bacterium]